MWVYERMKETHTQTDRETDRDRKTEKRQRGRETALIKNNWSTGKTFTAFLTVYENMPNKFLSSKHGLRFQCQRNEQKIKNANIRLNTVQHSFFQMTSSMVEIAKNNNSIEDF